MTIFFDEKRNQFVGRETINGIRKTFYGKDENIVRNKIENAMSEKLCGVTLNEWLDTWFETYKIHDYKKSTYEKELDRTKRIRESSLGTKDIKMITTSEIQEFINSLTLVLASKTIICIISLLKGSLKQAVAERLIDFNPCDYVSLPKLNKPDVVALNSHQKNIFIEQAKDNKFYDIFIFALNTGMRESEILGLTKDCIDFSNGFISVKQQRQKIKGSYIISTPKTRQSIRKVPMNTTTYNILQKNISHENDFVFLYDNKPVSQSSLGRQIRIIYSKCYELTHDETFIKANFHSLRHTFATQWILQNGNVNLLSKCLGHTDPAFTQRVYVQPSYSDIQTEMSKLIF